MSTRREFLTRATCGMASSLTASAEASAVLPGVRIGTDPSEAKKPMRLPTESDSDVGSLLPFIQAQAVKGEPSLSFLRAAYRDLTAWKRQGRKKLLDLLHYAPPKCAPRAEVVSKVDRGDYVQETIQFNTTPDLRVPACVLIPKNARLPAPAIIALHDHGGFYLWGREKLIEAEDEHPVLTQFKQRYYAGRSFAADLARQGYVVIVIDMFYWGERRLLLPEAPADWRERPRTIAAERIEAFDRFASQNESLVGRTIAAAGFLWSAVMFWDDLRTVDYLITRPEVDKSRIGCVGLSIGGLRACHLAALDDRIKAAIVVGWMTSFPAQLKRHVRYTIGDVALVPGLYHALDYPDVAALAMPTALLVINGKKDTLFAPDGVQAAFDKLAACYQKAGISERLRTRLVDAPHEFNREMQAEAWEWLRKWV